MPMKLKQRINSKKHKQPAHDGDDRKRLYVQCDSMVNEQYAADKSLGKIVYINDDEHPVRIDNDHFTGWAVFRVRDFDGWTPIDTTNQHRAQQQRRARVLPIIPTIPYFDGHRRAFSIQMSGRFKQEWTGDDVLFGTWFDQKLVLPRGYSVALAFASQIDRSMTYQMDGDRPYICSPLICAMNVINFEPVFHSPAASTAPPAAKTWELPDWKWYDGNKLEENLLAVWPTWPHPSEARPAHHPPTHYADISDDSKAARHRRSWFLDVDRRRHFRFHPDVVYSWDFFSPYVDVNRMQLKLGLTIDMRYYLDGQPLRYQARSRDGRVVFFEFVVGLA